MYKIFNKLFGFDYIYWENTADQGVARVFVTKDGNICYWRYRSTRLLDKITNPSQVVWLTCSPTKYFKEN